MQSKKPSFRKPKSPVSRVDRQPTETSIRVSRETCRMMDACERYYTEVLLQSPDQEVRESALDLSREDMLNVVLRSFIRDYRVPYTPIPKPEVA